MKTSGTGSVVRRGLHRLLVAAAATVLTSLFFLVLPFIQTIGASAGTDTVLNALDVAPLPPPPPPAEEPAKEPEPVDPPPELAEEAPPLDLAELELALQPGSGEGWMQGDLGVKLQALAAGPGEVDDLFTMAELDQTPRVVYQPSPPLSAALRKKAPGTVYVLFVVDRQGRVENPVVQQSTDPVFEKPALSAVKQWKFEPGKRNGQAVRFRMRVPITFPEA